MSMNLLFAASDLSVDGRNGLGDLRRFFLLRDVTVLCIKTNLVTRAKLIIMRKWYKLEQTAFMPSVVRSNCRRIC